MIQWETEPSSPMPMELQPVIPTKRSIAYNALGWRTVMTDGVGVTAWDYDGMGYPLSITDPITGTVGYTFDGQGNRTSLLYPINTTVAYTYDSLNRLIQVADWDTGLITYAYNDAEQLLETYRPNWVVSTYVYDDTDRLLNLAHTADQNNFLLPSMPMTLWGTELL